MYTKTKKELEKYLTECQIKEYPTRIKLFSEALKNVTVEGLYAEFGVHAGSSMKEIIDIIPNKKIYGFDVFNQPMAEDFTPQVVAGMFCLPEEFIPKFPNSNVEIIRGFYEDTLEKFLQEHKEPFAFIHFDSDIYSPTKYLLSALTNYGRIVKGTIMQFDELFYLEDNVWYCGEYLAFEEFVQEFKVKFTFLAKKEHHVALRIDEIHYTYCFDLDGVICNNSFGFYTKAKPIYSRIEKINELYRTGNIIKIFTARGTTSNKDHSELTQNQLAEWGVKYHELIFKKPAYNILIDDKAKDMYEFFKE